MSNQFATNFPLNYPINGCFIVQNILDPSITNKTINIFNYPIPIGKTRDLLKIYGVSESDIRTSLLKGTLRNKIIAKEIRIVCSDIDLLQFNDTQKQFLLQAGVITGLGVTGGGGSGDLTETIHNSLRALIHFVEDGPADGFASGAYKEILGQPFYTSETWYTASDKTKKIVEKLITRNGDQLPISITWNMYAADGTTVLHTITDTITYINNSFESTRTRSIS